MAKEYDFKGKLFYIDPSWQRTLRRLDILERAKIWDAIMDYRLNGVEVCLTDEISEKAEGVYWAILDSLTRFDTDAQQRSEIRRQAVLHRYSEKTATSVDREKKNTNATNVDFVGCATNATSVATIPYHTIPNHTIPKENNTLKSVKEKAGQNIFCPPVSEEVREFMSVYVSQKRKEGVFYNPPSACHEDFIDFYASKNWMVGKNKMKDWRAAARKWVRGQQNHTRHPQNTQVDNIHFAGENDRSVYNHEEENWK